MVKSTASGLTLILFFPMSHHPTPKPPPFRPPDWLRPIPPATPPSSDQVPRGDRSRSRSPIPTAPQPDVQSSCTCSLCIESTPAHQIQQFLARCCNNSLCKHRVVHLCDMCFEDVWRSFEASPTPILSESDIIPTFEIWLFHYLTCRSHLG